MNFKIRNEIHKLIKIINQNFFQTKSQYLIDITECLSKFFKDWKTQSF